MSSKSKLWHLENFNLFKGLTKEQFDEMAYKTKMSSATKNQYVYFPEEPSTSIFLLKSGRIKIGTYSEGGKEIIKTILQPGDIFGELSLTDEGKRTDFAQAMEDDVLICAMSKDYMEKLMSENPKLSMQITKLIGFRLKKMERRLSDLIFKNGRTRIIDFIKELAQERGQKVGTEVLIKHNLTHQDIANLTATSRQTVTTILNELIQSNLIYQERKKLLVRDLEKLE